MSRLGHVRVWLCASNNVWKVCAHVSCGWMLWHMPSYFAKFWNLDIWFRTLQTSGRAFQTRSPIFERAAPWFVNEGMMWLLVICKRVEKCQKTFYLNQTDIWNAYLKQYLNLWPHAEMCGCIFRRYCVIYTYDSILKCAVVRLNCKLTSECFNQPQ